MTLITTIDDRGIELLPFFLDHYTRLGIDRFVVGVYMGRDNPHFAELEAVAAHRPVELEESTCCPYDDYCGQKDADWGNTVRSRLTGWYATADLDEFIDFGGRSFNTMRELAESRGCHTVATTDGHAFIDRISAVGFPKVPQWGEGSLDATFPLACDLTRARLGGTSKTVMARADVEILSGHHYTRGHPVLRDAAVVHHFKWKDGIKDQLTRRQVALTAQGKVWAHEQSKFLQLFGDPAWRERPELKVRPAQRLGI